VTTERRADQTAAEERDMATTSPKAISAGSVSPKGAGGKSTGSKRTAPKSTIPMPAGPQSPGPKSLGKDLEFAECGRADQAIEHAIDELKHAVETGKTDADAMLAAATQALTKAAHTLGEETRRRSSEVTKVAAKEVHDHPVRATAIATAVVAAIAGLVLAIRQAPRKLLG
jgi:ElaB/YqjD/DUF883 family membrane-anchored ribosome-binding protein